MTFSELGLEPKILQALAEAGYDTPTPIQRDAIPEALTGRDVLGIAQTGTGKTASFTLPMIHRLARGRGGRTGDDRRALEPRDPRRLQEL